MKFDFNPELFNDLYWHLKKDLSNHLIRYIFLYGGSSASKTYTYVQSDITALLEHKNENVMVLRKYGVDIKDSIYSDYVKIINDWGLQQYFKCQINYIECLLTGSYVRFRGLDDSEKIKGLANFKRVVLEEISQFDEVDLKQIRKRLRGRSNQQIIGLFNPIDETHWLKVNLFDKENLVPQKITTNISEHYINEKGNFVVYKVNYLNNYFIVGKWKDGKQIGGFVDQHTIDDFEKDKTYDFNYYQIYALGNWGSLRTGGEFYKKFKAENHVKKAIYNPSIPLHISWDDNVVPYLPCGIFQIEGMKVKMIDEIAGISPENTVKSVCNEIKRKYNNHQSGMFLYGDATANKRDTKLEQGQNFYTIIEDHLKEYKITNRVSRSNPSVVMRGNWINNIFESNISNIEIIIGENCTKTITDFNTLKEAPDGTKLKETAKDPNTGARFQKVGHFTDLFDYLICTVFQREYELYLNDDFEIESDWE